MYPPGVTSQANDCRCRIPGIGSGVENEFVRAKKSSWDFIFLSWSDATWRGRFVQSQGHAVIAWTLQETNPSLVELETLFQNADHACEWLIIRVITRDAASVL
jgi:hypothetical protein